MFVLIERFIGGYGGNGNKNCEACELSNPGSFTCARRIKRLALLPPFEWPQRFGLCSVLLSFGGDTIKYHPTAQAIEGNQMENKRTIVHNLIISIVLSRIVTLLVDPVSFNC